MASAAVILSALALALQDPGGSVGGVILDAATGQPLHGATVALTDLNRSVSTDARGRYRFTAVPPGPQHLTARYLGYASRTVHALVPPVGEVEIGIALTPLPTRLTSVEIRRHVPVRHGVPADAERDADRTMSLAEIRHQPLLAEADVLEALGGGGVAVDPEAPTGVHIHGAPADHTAYLLDGFPVFSPYHAAGLFGAFNPDAVGDVFLWSSTAAPEHVAALGGVIATETRPAGERWGAMGSASATQARLTLDGPIGDGPMGALIALRTGFPGLFASAGDASHIQGESGDRIATVSTEIGRDTLRALYYDSENELSAASDTFSLASGHRNAFAWESRTAGGEWRRGWRTRTLTVRAWHAEGTSRAVWRADSAGETTLRAVRRDRGALASIALRRRESTTTALLRLEHIATTGASWSSLVDGSDPDHLRGAPTVLTLGLDHAQSIGRDLHVRLGGGVAHANGAASFSPALALRWSPDRRANVRLTASRRHQFAQSLRNDESLVGTVFPADLYAAAGTAGVPVARGDQMTLSVDLQSVGSFGIALLGHVRRTRGLVLAAASTGEPFALDPLASGTGRSAGAALEVSKSATRYALLASYGWQQTRVRNAAGRYAPRYASAHRVDAGVIGYPGPTLSLRLGTTLIAGRRGSPAYGALEWESCNLLDLGCEFGGSPRTDPADAGTVELPTYVRVDVGARKHWHVQVHGRDVAVAVFGTLTNIMGRANTLAYAIDPISGDRFPITMRPRAPLIIGVDWQF